MEPEQSLQQRAALAAQSVVPRHEGIAVCLSGGGYRAALFHLGALRRLHEMGLFPVIRAISSVSGGSIMAAFLANVVVTSKGTLAAGFPGWQRQISDPFRRLCARDIRTWPFLLHLPWNWVWPKPRVRHLQWLYRRLLTSLRLGELPHDPRFILCATDLVFGASWESSRDRTGDWRAGYVRDAEQWPVSRAVAASSAFPPIFGPLLPKIPKDGWVGGSYQEPDRDLHRGQVALSDGGVYDNMGLEPAWKVYTNVLVSDAGAPFEFRIGEAPWSRLLRYTSVITSQTRALRLRAFFSELKAGLYAGAYWSLTSGVIPQDDVGEPYRGYSQELAKGVIARIRTDLDCFDEAEMSVLENHGYYAAERALRRHFPTIIPAGAPEAAPPYPEWVEEGKVRRALRNSHRRVMPGRLLRGILQGP